MKRSLGLLAAVAALLPFLVSAANPNNMATMTLAPASGPATTSVTATLTLEISGQTPCPTFYQVTFSWDAQQLGTSTVTSGATCAATLTFVPPAASSTVGDHQVCGDTGPNGPAPNQQPYQGCATFTVVGPTAPPTPVLTPTPAPTPAPTATPTPSPSPSSSPQTTPTPTPSPSPSPSSSPATTPTASPAPAIASGSVLPPAGSPPALALSSSAIDGLLPWGLLIGVLIGLAIPATMIVRRGPPSRRVASGLVIGLVIVVGIAGAGDRIGVWAVFPHPTLSMDNSRVTQGLDFDYGNSAAVAYDKIAGKDTLARAQLRVTDLGAGKVRARCLISPAAGDGGIGEVSATDPNGVDAVITQTSGTASSDSSSPTTATYRADCWIPGYRMAPAGLTDVVMTVWVTGLHARTFLVGTPNLRLGTDLRLLVYPQVWPVQDVGASEAQPWAFCGGIPLKDLKAKCPKVQPALLRHAWDSSESATAYNILEQLDRVWPVRSGVGGIDLTGSATHSLGTPGLRYYFAPIDDSCPPFPVNPTNGLRTLACTSDLRVDAQLMVESMNARSAAADAADGRHRDRLDHSFVLTATAPGATGGQCTMGGLYGNGSEIDTDPDGGGSYVAAQELTHCVGKMLDATSPHSDGPDTTHSKNNSIAHPSDQPGVNMLTHADVADPQSVMPKSSGARASQIFMEGWDFDYFRGIINALYRTDTAPSNYRLVAATSNHHLTVSLNISGDAASLRWAGAEDGALRNTPPIPTGAYAVVLKDASGTELSRLPFDIPPVALHPGPETTSIGLIADLPGTTAQLDVVHGATTMLSQRFSGAPAIGGVNASINSDGSGADISWQNGAPGTLYSVWYSEHAGSAPIPVAYGLRDAAAHLGLALTAPTDSAVFTVRASDGLHVTSVNAKPLVIPARPPLVAITSPSAGITLTDIEPVTLHAIAFDAAQGPLPDSEVAWTVDGAALGSGVTQITQLTAGDHAAVVTATTTSGATSARATLHVTHKAMPSLVPAPPQAEVRDLGSCPSLAQASVSLPGGTNASSDAGWLKISSAKGGSARLDIDCRMVPSGATLTAPIVFAAASGTVQVLWVQAHGGGIAVPVWLKVVLAILLIAIVTASVGILTLRRIGTVRPTS